MKCTDTPTARQPLPPANGKLDAAIHSVQKHEWRLTPVAWDAAGVISRGGWDTTELPPDPPNVWSEGDTSKPHTPRTLLRGFILRVRRRLPCPPSYRPFAVCWFFIDKGSSLVVDSNPEPGTHDMRASKLGGCLYPNTPSPGGRCAGNSRSAVRLVEFVRSLDAPSRTCGPGNGSLA